MIIEYQDYWRTIRWEGINDLTLAFKNDKGDIIKFSLTPEEKDKLTLFTSGYNKGLRVGKEK